MPDLTAAQKQAIETSGYGLAGDIGGIPRQTYYTPDGRVIKAIPSIREYVIKDKDGKVKGSGTRDANLDKGWLLQPPAVPKPYCPTCDRWHDTPEQVAECKRKYDALIARYSKTANTEKEPDDRVAGLEAQVSELTQLVKQLLGGKSGAILQQPGSEQTIEASGGNGTSEEGLQ